MGNQQFWGSVLIALASAGGVTAVIQWLQNRRKVNAEAGSILAEASRALIEPLTKRVEALEAENAKHERQHQENKLRIDHLEAGVRILTRQLEEQNITPAWRLPT